MIERNRGRYIPTCDYCSNSLSPEVSKDDAIMAMKYAGWSSPTIGERINNYCGKCSKHLGFERPKDKSREYSRSGLRRDHSPAKGTEDHKGKAYVTQRAAPDHSGSRRNCVTRKEP